MLTEQNIADAILLNRVLIKEKQEDSYLVDYDGKEYVIGKGSERYNFFHAGTLKTHNNA